MKQTVAAVVVTYNRKEMLLKCLKGILSQTHPVDALFIIDNASTDDTLPLLIREGYLPSMAALADNESNVQTSLPLSDSPNKTVFVYYYRLRKNRGSAGGFREGMKQAYHQGYEWVWTMDDDVIPQAAALENQLKYHQVSRCIHPVRVNPDGTPFPEHLHINPPENGNGFFEVESCCFEGLLVHRDVLSRVGFPDGRFFIVLDDKEYGLRISTQTPIIYVRNAKFIKQISPVTAQIGNQVREVMPVWKLYYLVRNLFLIRSSHPHREFSGWAIVRKILRITFMNVIYYPNRFKALRNIAFGVWDGLNGKFGQTTRNLQ